MMRAFAWFAAALTAITLGVGNAQAAEEAALSKHDWSFDGPIGHFDRDALKRGFHVYDRVCSACHSLNLIAYRNLEAIGFTPAEVAAIAAEREIEDGPNDDGDMFFRPARPSDHVPPPFPNEKAARAANNGALPPDLSLMVKARKGGPDYVYALLTGYQDPPPEGVSLMDGMHYNTVFSGNQIAMAPPLFDDVVEYDDGTKATVPQLAEDIVTFLTWTASPEMESRKNLGIKVLIFLVVLVGFLIALKRRIWSDVH